MADIALAEVINHAKVICTNAIKANSPLNRLEAVIKCIGEEMSSFQSLLKDLETKPAKTPEVVTDLIADIRDIAVDISDILHTHLSESEAHKRKGWSRFAKHIPSCYGTTANNYASQTERLKLKMDRFKYLVRKINHNKIMDDQANEDAGTQCDQGSFLTKDSLFIGRKESLERLKAELLSINSECQLISVVGVQGIGKTSLVTKLCRELQDRFEFSTLVYVSDKPSVRDLLLEIARKAGLGEDKMDEDLEVNLLSLLAEKRCLIYLDDIRRSETWDELEKALPTSSTNHSRIIITCRYTNVGRYIASDQRCLIKLTPLDSDDSWELFSKRMNLFSENTNKKFKETGEEIIQICHGFPLAIVSAVDMLKEGRDEHAVWKKVLDKLRKRDESYITNIWCLSYKELPMELRHLFLYVGLYPVESKISVSELTRALLADKLIQLQGNEDPEDIVEANLEKLSDFNLIQVSTRRLNGRIRSCCMNHFQHKVCTRVARESNLFATANKITVDQFFSRARRLTFENYDLSQYLFLYFLMDNFSKTTDTRLRTLLFFTKDGQGFLIPDEIGHLRRLNFLKVTGEYLLFPSMVKRLKKLETLDIGKASFRFGHPPQSIWKMESIKHLLLSRDLFNLLRNNTDGKKRFKFEVNLPNVETLGWITGEILKTSSEQNLSNLKKLKLFETTAEQIEEFSRLGKLQQLWLNDDPQKCTNLIMSDYHNLVRLHLSYDWSHVITLDHIQFPSNLIELVLKGIKFKGDPMSALKKLPKLKFLKLKQCLYLLILNCCGPDSFRELLALEITDSFSKLVVDDTGMPKLQKFVYGGDAEPNIPDRLREIMTIKPTDETVYDMGGRRDKTKEPMAWSDENEKAFMKIMYESVKSRTLQRPTFTKDKWDKINQDMLIATKLDYGTQRLKDKWNQLCISHRLFSQLLGHSGVTWDPNANHVNATEEIWQKFYKINKTEYETFRKEGCKYYEVVREILGKPTSSTGGLENDPTHRHDDDISRKHKHQNEASMISKTELEAFLAQWLGKSFNQLIGNAEGTSRDPYSNVVCLNILNKMEGLSDEVYVKAINAFENPNFRISFVMMPANRRRHVLELI